MKWSEKAWSSIAGIYSETLELPFIKELMAGTLDRETFVYYIKQDAIYLADYGRTLTGLASRLADPAHIEAFIRFAGDSIVSENILHESFFREFGITEKSVTSPTCLLYTSFLLKHLAGSPVEVAAAAVLPCFWIYKEVGDYILENQTKGQNPYQAWIDTYGGDEFGQAVEKAIDICDELAAKCTPEQQDAMTEAFVICSKLEWMFWDSAYRREEWEI